MRSQYVRYRQTGVLAACVECCRPDCWTDRHVPLITCKRWAKLFRTAGVHVRALSVVHVHVAMSIPCLHKLHVNLTPTQHSLIPLASCTVLPTCACHIACPLTSSDGSDWTHAPQLPFLSDRVPHLTERTGQATTYLPTHLLTITPPKVGSSSFLLLLLHHSLARDQFAHQNHSAFPPTNPYQSTPTNNPSPHYTYDFTRPSRPQRQPQVPRHQGLLRGSGSTTVLSLQTIISC